jgi:hypothetical protein
MYWELHIDIVDFNMNGKTHTGMLSRANWWTVDKRLENGGNFIC